MIANHDRVDELAMGGQRSDHSILERSRHAHGATHRDIVRADIRTARMLLDGLRNDTAVADPTVGHDELEERRALSPGFQKCHVRVRQGDRPDEPGKPRARSNVENACALGHIRKLEQDETVEEMGFVHMPQRRRGDEANALTPLRQRVSVARKLAVLFYGEVESEGVRAFVNRHPREGPTR